MTFTRGPAIGRVLGVQEEYLAAAWRAIDEEFGSLVAYLRDSGITEDDVARLRGEPLS
jgi:protein-tyrosine phosphatase